MNTDKAFFEKIEAVETGEHDLTMDELLSLHAHYNGHAVDLIYAAYKMGFDRGQKSAKPDRCPEFRIYRHEAHIRYLEPPDLNELLPGCTLGDWSIVELIDSFSTLSSALRALEDLRSTINVTASSNAAQVVEYYLREYTDGELVTEHGCSLFPAELKWGKMKFVRTDRGWQMIGKKAI